MTFKLIGVALMASLAFTTSVEADTNESLKVIISGGFEQVYEKMLPGFEESTGIKVVTSSGASNPINTH